MFHILEHSSGQRPYMAVAFDETGRVVAHMLAFTRRRNTWIPPFLYMQGRIFGEGVYAGEQDKEQIFGLERFVN